MNKLLTTLAAGLVALTPAAAQTAQRLTASKANEYGLIYSLPTTVVDITIEAEHTECTPGPFYNYSRLKLGVDNAITAPSKSVTIKSVTFTPRGVADNDNRWLVQFKAGSTPYIILADNNCPVAVNTARDRRRPSGNHPGDDNEFVAVETRRPRRPAHLRAARDPLRPHLGSGREHSARRQIAAAGARQPDRTGRRPDGHVHRHDKKIHDSHDSHIRARQRERQQRDFRAPVASRRHC